MAALGCWLIVIPTSLLTNYTGVGVAGHIGAGGSAKYECVYLKAYGSVSAARTDIAQYLAWYTTHRSHSSLDRSTPDEAYFAGMAPLKMAA